MHADFAERGNSVEVFARDEYETDCGDERVDFVDDDALPAAQEAADLGIVPSEGGLHFVTFRAMQRMAQSGLDEGRISHDSTPRNVI